MTLKNTLITLQISYYNMIYARNIILLGNYIRYRYKTLYFYTYRYKILWMIKHWSVYDPHPLLKNENLKKIVVLSLHLQEKYCFKLKIFS